jgi:hypothetical protein
MLCKVFFFEQYRVFFYFTSTNLLRMNFWLILIDVNFFYSFGIYMMDKMILDGPITLVMRFLDLYVVFKFGGF